MIRSLLPVTVAYRAGIAVRRAAYRRGWLRSRRLSRPVLSVGNLTLGGTGKTPLVAYLAERLLQRGWKPCILTRGYGRKAGRRVVVLEPRTRRVADPREVGDEPALLARSLPEVPIVVCANRYAGGRVAENLFEIDVHLLDDGFQHWALARNVDVLTLDITQDFFNEALLPAGRLREPCSALRRAHLVVLTRVELGDPAPLENVVSGLSPCAKIFHSRVKLSGLVDVASGTPHAPGAFQGELVYAFCGIGNPGAFFADLRGWGFSLVGEHIFPDHYVYTKASLRSLFNSALRKSHPVALITTEKDAVNLPPLERPPIPVMACIVRVEVQEAERFEGEVLDRLKATR